MARPEYAHLVYPWLIAAAIALGGAGVTLLNHFLLGTALLMLIAWKCVSKGADIVLDHEESG